MTSGTVLIMTCTAFFIYELITYRDITRQQLTTLSSIIAHNSTAALAFDDKSDATEILNALAADKHIQAACLYDSTGKLFARYPEDLKEVPKLLKGDGYEFEGRYLQGFGPVMHNGNRLGTIYIRTDLNAVYERFLLYGAIMVMFILISFLFAYLLSRRLQRSISDPLLELAETAKQISHQQDYSVRAVKRNDDEVGLLTDAFNHMVNRIEVQNSEITAFSHMLEDKVATRTQELAAANGILKQQNDFVESILDSSVDIIAVFDTEYRYLTVNNKACQFYNKSREDLVGKHLLKVFPTLENSTMVRNLEKAFEGQAIYNHQYQSIVTQRQLDNFYIPLRNQHGEVDRVLVIGHDITAILETNEKLKKANRDLEKSNRDLEQFAYVASHDLQEPLRKIQTFSELSEKHITNPEILSRYLGKIYSSAKRMTDLIKAVLNYSRLSVTDEAYAAIDINAIIEHLKTDLELAIEEKGAQIEVQKMPEVRGIQLQLNQLFLNLITNSLKFCTDHPRIQITYTELTPDDVKANLHLNKDYSYICIRFQDNGIGFDQQYADKVFTIFQRLHTGEQYAGTGIGLALCKKIVENHQGSIRVESRQGMGTTFLISLPLSTTTERKPQEASSRSSVTI
jgi:PAS domain S-box-containing protein